MSIVYADQIYKRFDALNAVDGVSFEVHSGECFGLLGPNGAGKSTLISILYGAASRSGGTLKVLGLDPALDAKTLRRKLGVVMQENALDDSLTVRENLEFFARFLSIPREERGPRIAQLLTFMSLEHKADGSIRTLSGGMQRRLTFARALLGRPEFVILDEPTTGLDPAVRQLLWTRVRDLKAQGTTILLTTHYMEEAEQLCDRLVIMDEGKIRAHGSPRALIQQYCPNSTANLESVFLKITGRELSIDA